MVSKLFFNDSLTCNSENGTPGCLDGLVSDCRTSRLESPVLIRRCRTGNQSYMVLCQASRLHCVSGSGAILSVTSTVKMIKKLPF